MTASNFSTNGSISLSAPNVRVIRSPHAEPKAGTGTFDVNQRLQVSASDYSENVEDLRIELLRRRKLRTDSSGNIARGLQWVHPADHAGQANGLDGGRSRGGNHYDTNGNPLVARQTSFPVTGEYVWEDVDVAGWFRAGNGFVFDQDGNDTQLSIPVQTGTKSNNVYDIGPSHLPQWKTDGETSMRIAFRLSVIDPDGEDSRDRLTGPVSASVIVRPAINTNNDGFPFWPDGQCGATGVASTNLSISMEGIR